MPLLLKNYNIALDSTEVKAKNRHWKHAELSEIRQRVFIFRDTCLIDYLIPFLLSLSQKPATRLTADRSLLLYVLYLFRIVLMKFHLQANFKFSSPLVNTLLFWLMKFRQNLLCFTMIIKLWTRMFKLSFAFFNHVVCDSDVSKIAFETFNLKRVSGNDDSHCRKSPQRPNWTGQKKGSASKRCITLIW